MKIDFAYEKMSTKTRFETRPEVIRKWPIVVIQASPFVMSLTPYEHHCRSQFPQREEFDRSF